MEKYPAKRLRAAVPNGHTRHVAVALIHGLSALALAITASCGGSDNDPEIQLFPEEPPEEMGSGGQASASGAGGGTGPSAGGATSGAAGGVSASGGGSTSSSAGSGSGSGGASDAGMMPTSPGSGGIAMEGDAAMPPGDPPSPLIGSYAVRITQRDDITVGLVGSSSMKTVVLGHAEIVDSGDEGLSLSMTMCDYRVAPDATEKHLTDLTLAMPPDTLDSTVIEGATITLGADDTSWETSELHGVAGWQWDSPDDSLPSSADDPRIVDQDDDGNPGVSLPFTGHEMGTLYLALVFRWTLSGTIDESGNLTGETRSKGGETLLGSDQNPLIVNSFERVPDSDPTDNTVMFVRQPGPMACDGVRAAADSLFP